MKSGAEIERERRRKYWNGESDQERMVDEVLRSRRHVAVSVAVLVLQALALLVFAFAFIWLCAVLGVVAE